MLAFIPEYICVARCIYSRARMQIGACNCLHINDENKRHLLVNSFLRSDSHFPWRFERALLSLLFVKRKHE